MPGASESPAGATVKGLLLAPGAGAGADQSSLVAIDHRAGALGLTVERVDFPYRLAGRSRPDQPAVLEATIATAAALLAQRVGGDTQQLVLGGRSMGGRICSQVVAAGMAAAGLALISYPLHPPGRPDRMRTAHFPDLTVPCLFVSGTRDAFGSPEELTAAAASIAGPVTHVWIEGGDHSLRRRDEVVAAAVAEWINRLGLD